MQGWQKATTATKKRLLRRTIKAITITRNEILITFWLNAEDSRGGFIEGSEIGSDGSENIVSLRRVSPQAPDRNLSIISSGNVGIGSERRT